MMFTKLEQRAWLNIQCACGHTAQKCHVGLVEACGDAALPYRTVARWVKAFNAGHNRVEHMPRPDRPSVSEEDVEHLSAQLDIDRRQTVRELALEIGLSHMTVSHFKDTPQNAKNCISVSSLGFDRGAMMASI
ncbi:hypothetical protein C0J52_24188 [Blattella germanica]|nr:hypothetical protein C0J52_24188 [Blattella germanica]